MPMTPGPERRRAVPQAHPVVDRRVAVAARPRLRRPLPDPPLRPERPDRGDDGGAARRGARRARPATSARAACTPGSSPRRSTPPTRHGWTRFVSMQNHYNLVYREEEREMIPQCLDMGVGVIPWSPLARGLLAGNRTRDGEKLTARAETDGFADFLYTHPTDFDVVDRVVEVAGERGVAPHRSRSAWLLHQARGHRPHRRRDQARPPRGRAGRRTARAQRRRDRPAGGALRAPRHRWSLIGARRRRVYGVAHVERGGGQRGRGA